MKPALSQAAGSYLHAEQCAPLTPYGVQQNGTRYQDLPEAFFVSRLGKIPFRVLPKREAEWAHGSYLINPDGQLVLAHFNYDSSD